MKWIGQHIWDFISRFRSDVYLEGTETGTIASGGNLGLDSNNKVVKAAEVGSSVDLTSEVTGVLPVTNGGSGASSLTNDCVLTGTGTSAITAETDLKYYGTTNLLEVSASSGGGPYFAAINTADSATSGSLTIANHRSGGGHDDDYVGSIYFQGKDDDSNSTHYGRIDGKIVDAADGSEAGSLEFKVAENDSTLTTGLKLEGQPDDDGEVDVTIGAGAASTTTIAGDLDIDGDNMTSAGAMTFTPVGKYTIAAPDLSDVVFHLDANADTDNVVDIDAGVLNIDSSGATTITAAGTAELAGSTVTLDSAGAITFEAHGSATVEVGAISGTLPVVDLVKYLLPNDFIVNDAAFIRGYLYAADDAGSNYGGTWQDAGLQSWAWYQIPKGFKVTHIHAYGNTTHASTDCMISQLDPTDGTRGPTLASGAWGSSRELSTHITSANDAVALVVLDNYTATDIIYSVKLTLALV